MQKTLQPRQVLNPDAQGKTSVWRFLSSEQRTQVLADARENRYHDPLAGGYVPAFDRSRGRRKPARVVSPAGLLSGGNPAYRNDMPHAGIEHIRLGMQPEHKVRVKAYATGRIAISTYRACKKPLKKRMSRARLAAVVRGPGKFISCSEVRRTWLIAGRRRGLPQIQRWTAWARDLVRDAASCIESYAEGTCFFITLTVPCEEEQAVKAFSAGSGYAMDRLNRWLREKLVGGLFTYVWEVQGRGAPHLHLMVRLRGDALITELYSSLRKKWHEILCRVQSDTGARILTTGDGLDITGDSDLLHVHLKVVKYDYGGYISKYVSKSRTKGGGAHNFRPGRWWGISDNLRRLVESRRLNAAFSVPSAAAGAAFVESICARGFSLFEKLVCFPARELFCADIYSFDCSPRRGREVAQAVLELGLFGDVTRLEELINERRNWNEARTICGAEPRAG